MKVQFDQTEKTIIKALVNGDTHAFDNLFTTYAKRLYYFAYGYLKSREDAEEIVQEVFLKIWKNRKDLKSELSFKGYLFKIAYHQILELFEKINRQQQYKHTILEEAIHFTDDLNERLNYQLLLEKVDIIINKLPERQRVIITKRKKDDLSVKQIAKQLSIKPKTVENHLTEAIKKLKSELGKENISPMLFFCLFVNI